MKRQSKAAKLSSDVERLQKQVKRYSQTSGLSEDAMLELGTIFSKSNQLISNACVDDISESLRTRLFGGGQRGHYQKLVQYRKRIADSCGTASVGIGFLVEFHTALQGWIWNDGFLASDIGLGIFPLSKEVYGLLERASKGVDWLVLAFCPPYGRKVVDSAIVDCRNGKFRLSMERQDQMGLEYLGLGKETPHGRQARRGTVELRTTGNEIQYSIENTSEPIDAMELFTSSIDYAAKAINLKRARKSFVSSIPVQLVCYLTEDYLKVNGGPVDSLCVRNTLLALPNSTVEIRSKAFAKRWGIG